MYVVVYSRLGVLFLTKPPRIRPYVSIRNISTPKEKKGQKGQHYHKRTKEPQQQQLLDTRSSYFFLRFALLKSMAVQSTKSSHANFRFFVKTLLFLRFQSSDRDQMKDMKILKGCAQNRGLFERKFRIVRIGRF